MRSEYPGRPSRFVALPADREPTKGQLRKTCFKLRLCIVRPRGKSCFGVQQRFCWTIEAAQCACPIGQHLRVPRRELQRRIVARYGVLRPIELQHSVSAITQSLDIVTIHRERALKALQSLTRPSKIQQRNASCVENLRVVWLAL